MPNRLADANSPYLLQHQDNPVDWFEWGDDAFAASKERDVPILLSVGYSACHWCHVMAHESFEDPETAAVMNEHFVNVKVDREERPDVDRIYMDAVQAMTGRGGWPMTVFLTPDGKPFFAGTYFPKDDMHGHPSFRRVLLGVTDAWHHRRAEVTGQADTLTAAITERLPAVDHPPTAQLAATAVDAMRGTFDREHGGFGGAPKFPQAPNLELLLRAGADRQTTRDFLAMTLEKMARGGIYDHVGGGFARYAVDRIWLVPHFEKMLYDNALLARLYARAWQVLGDDNLARVARETLDYLLRDLRHPDGGFYSAEDADSEGVEGKFYVWTQAELRDVLGDDAAFAESFYGVTESGNFEGATILNEVAPWSKPAPRDRVDAIRRRLLEHRSGRIRPGLDDKVVTAWNGLAIRAFAEAGAVFDDVAYIDAARDCADFVLSRLRRHDGRLMRSWRDGSTSVPGFADDYAAMAVGLYALYQATGESRWFEQAEALLADLRMLFRDPEGGFFATGDDAEELIARPKNLMDNPTPSENSLAAEALFIHLGLTGDATATDDLAGILRAAGALVDRYPSAVGHLLAVLHSTGHGPVEVAVTGRDTHALRRVVWSRFRPHTVLAVEDESPPIVPLLEGRVPNDGRQTAHVCEGFVCAMPVHTAEALAEQLDTEANVG